jgi:hypothetical protein
MVVLVGGLVATAETVLIGVLISTVDDNGCGSCDPLAPPFQSRC